MWLIIVCHDMSGLVVFVLERTTKHKVKTLYLLLTQPCMLTNNVQVKTSWACDHVHEYNGDNDIMEIMTWR